MWNPIKYAKYATVFCLKESEKKEEQLVIIEQLFDKEIDKAGKKLQDLLFDDEKAELREKLFNVFENIAKWALEERTRTVDRKEGAAPF